MKIDTFSVSIIYSTTFLHIFPCLWRSMKLIYRGRKMPLKTREFKSPQKLLDIIKINFFKPRDGNTCKPFFFSSHIYEKYTLSSEMSTSQQKSSLRSSFVYLFATRPFRLAPFRESCLGLTPSTSDQVMGTIQVF